MKEGKPLYTTMHLIYSDTLSVRKKQFYKGWNKQYKEELKTLDQIKAELEQLGVSYLTITSLICCY